MNLWQAWKLWGLFGTIEKEATEKKTMNNTVTPGWKTSEFWLHILAQAPLVLGVFFPPSAPIVVAATIATNLAAAIYTACRSQVKVAAVGSALTQPALDLASAATAALNQLAAATPTAPAAVDPAAAPAAAPAPSVSLVGPKAP